MKVSKKRLTEIEKELNNLTIRSLIGAETLILHRANRELLHCPHCNRTGSSGGFRLSHFDNCVFKGINLEEFNKDLSIICKAGIVRKYNGINLKHIDKYMKVMGMKYVTHSKLKLNGKENWQLVNCPHCKMKGYKGQFGRLHLDKCVFKGIDLEQFNKELMELEFSFIDKKYGIPTATRKKYMKYHNIKHIHHTQKKFLNK